MFKRVSVILLLCLFAISSQAQNNLLLNPGFEDSVTVGWWLNAWGDAEASLSNETGTLVIFDSISAKVQVTAPGDKIEKVSLMSNPITNAPREGDLIITAYAKIDAPVYATLPFKLSLKCLSSSGERKWYGGSEETLKSGVKKFTFIISPDPNYRDTIYVRLSCGLKNGTYIFDDVVFAEYVDNPPPVPDGRRLREIVADNYPDGNVFIGGATQSGYWDTDSEIILNREFGYITPANDFKQTYIHPEPEVFRWDLPDLWVEKAQKNNQVIRMHSPISPQCSKWAKDDSRTPQELLQNLEEYVTAVCQRYNDYENVVWMDVVNETIDKTTGAWFGPKSGTDKWENPWTIIGFDTLGTLPDTMIVPHYIVRAFELANQYGPNIKQIINQHGTMNDAAWDRVKKLVVFLRAEGLRVDGIGFQGHMNVGWEKEVNDSGVNNITALGNLIDWAHTHDLDFHITENNVYLRDGNEGKWEEQAATFKAVVKMLLSKRESGLVTWNVWMIRDSDGIAANRTPVLFFEDGSAKPAYYAIQDVLEDTLSTGLNSVRLSAADFRLYDNYPNPFNPTTTIEYSIPRSSEVTLKVYDLLGREVNVLVDGRQNAGLHKVVFNAGNLASGVYIYKIEAGKFADHKKFILIK